MVDKITTNPQRSEPIVNKDGLPTDQQIEWSDDIELALNENLLGASGVQNPPYTVETLPPQKIGSQIFVSNESGGAVTAYSDGTNWRRSTDRAIVS